VRVAPGASNHPILSGVPAAFHSAHSLYRSRNLAPTTQTLLTGSIQLEGREVTEPVAWVSTNAQSRVFYTSLGGPDDFKAPAFRRLLVNAVFWSLKQPVPTTDAPRASTARRSS
jgi:type 1 glutamine amidotransferase